ncbi:Predicted ATPase [Kaistia soli DSM 19436]|uniref:Predicted ATPase n=1 Tax=Kaistia soli DSM 19436 TaxID=1122133 RepID=A0A1M5JZX9_9HYPH|nr:AAA family ATPase [Kaistia soli]SHG46132.1 Predicted ATPase [Kaistia soli DSM 19436]
MALPLTAVRIERYRSIRSIMLPVAPLTVLVGRNGVGKTNLYRALELLTAAARGSITHEIAAEGGLGSVLFAGPRETGPVRLRLGCEVGSYAYSIEIGLPSPMEAALTETEPMVKAEKLDLIGGGRKPVTLMKREGPGAWLRDGEGKRQTYETALLPSETALASFRDVERYTEVDIVRRALGDWRFFHNFRTDRESAIRKPALAVTTPTLASNGHDLAAALATVRQVRGEGPAIHAAIDDAFPGSRLITRIVDGRVALELEMRDLPRPLAASELSDGTLAFLCLVGALASYRLPGFIALNEPETSLHPELIPALARLIAKAAERTQVWVVTHSEPLAAALAREGDAEPRAVIKREGATWIEGLRLTGSFADAD